MWPFDKKVVYQDNAFTAINKELERLYKKRESYSSFPRTAAEDQKKVYQEHFWKTEREIEKFQDLLIKLAATSADPEHLGKIRELQDIVAETILLDKKEH